MEDKKWPIERILAVVTVFIILLLPTIGLNKSSGFFSITENTYMWPWMILIYLKPARHDLFQTEMYNIVLPPWTFLVFLPFFFALRLSYQQFKMEEHREKTALYIALAALIQIFLIWMIFQSQEPGISEQVTMIYLPELLILLLQGIFGSLWYLRKVEDTLNQPPSE